MTKCEFHKFGSSGTVQKFDALCVLPLNIINEKIYVFLWFWFICVTLITGIQVEIFLNLNAENYKLQIPKRSDQMNQAR